MSLGEENEVSDRVCVSCYLTANGTLPRTLTSHMCVCKRSNILICLLTGVHMFSCKTIIIIYIVSLLENIYTVLKTLKCLQIILNSPKWKLKVVLCTIWRGQGQRYDLTAWRWVSQKHKTTTFPDCCSSKAIHLNKNHFIDPPGKVVVSVAEHWWCRCYGPSVTCRRKP